MKSRVKEVYISTHANKRIDQRRIDINDIAYVLTNGKKIYLQGRIFHVMASKNLEWAYQKSKNLVVLTNLEGVIITVYRNSKAISKIKKMNKRGIKNYG